MIQSVYRKDTGRYCGCTATPEHYDTEVFGITDQTPPEFDDLADEMPYWTGTGWEIRNAS